MGIELRLDSVPTNKFGDRLGGNSSLPQRTDEPAVLQEEAVAFDGANSERDPLTYPVYTVKAGSEVFSASQSEDGTSSSDAGGSTSVTELSEQDESSIQSDSEHERVGNMSSGQARIWYLSQYLEDETTYNCTASYNLEGRLDITKFKEAFSKVINRHEILRTRFYTDCKSGKPMQAVMPKSMFKLSFTSELNDSKRHVEYETLRISRTLYKLGKGHAFEAALVQHATESFTFIFGFHHIILDGVSCGLLMREVGMFYSMPSTSVPIPPQFLDFVLDQDQLISSESSKSGREYWRKELSDLPGPLPMLPFANASSRKPLRRYETRDVAVALDLSLLVAIRKTCHIAKVSPLHFYFSVLQILLYRCAGVEDIIIGIAEANRSHKSFKHTMGFLLNFLPLRAKSVTGDLFSEVLCRTRSKAHEARNNPVPFDTIVRDLGIKSSSRDTPLFQVILNYRPGAVEDGKMNDVDINFVSYKDARNPFDIALSVDEKSDGQGKLTFSVLKYIYDQDGSNIIAKAYLCLLKAFAKDPTWAIADAPLFENTLLESNIETKIIPHFEMDWPETLSLRIDNLVAEQPNAIALKDSIGNTLTYKTMQRRTNSISVSLLKLGVKQGSHVAVHCDQSADAICSLMAVMKLGAVYVPLDIRNECGRLDNIINEVKPEVLIYHEQTASHIAKFPTLAGATLNISQLSEAECPDVPNVSRGCDPAFLLFTSGSTGKPKGVLLSHSNYRTQVIAASERMQLGREIILQQSALGFDASLAQIFYCLANGGTLIIASNRDDPRNLTRIMSDENVTFTLCVPSEYSMLLTYGREILKGCKSWRVAMCGGETFRTTLKAKFRDLELEGLSVFNAYGPSETAVASSIGNVDYLNATSTETIPIGATLAKYTVRILDEDRKPLPIGWPGEICIGGPGVAIGYFQNIELTAAKFSSGSTLDPTNRNYRLYYTGDKGKMLSNGELVFLGRLDDDSQVKIRGMRIELAEVTDAIIQASGGLITDAIVGSRGTDEDQVLVAYVVLARDCQMTTPDSYLRGLLRSLRLPPCMRPTVAIPIDKLPMTASGKLDKAALARIAIPAAQTSDQNENLGPVETRLKQIWEQILSETALRLHISKDSDFFSVGGNSLLLIKLQAELRLVFGVEIPIPQLFENNTLESLAKLVSGHQGNGQESDIDWNKETEIPEDFGIGRISLLNFSARRANGCSVLLTGATGFLGKSIVQELVSSDAIRYIHCVAVRASHDYAQQILGPSPKIVVHPGDLSLPLLGMSQEEHDTLIQKIDLIIHNGAEVSFMKTYQSIRISNVQSTKILAHFATKRGIPLHYVSSAGVAHLRGTESMGEHSVSDVEPPVDGSDGYVASKWASERFLERIKEQHNLPIYIHRPASIVGDGAPTMDIVNSVLRFSRKLRAVPIIRKWNGCFDFINVDQVAKDMVSIALEGSFDDGSTVPTYVHHSGEQVVPIPELKRHLEDEQKQNFREIPLSQWIDEASDQGMHELVRDFLCNAEKVGTELNMPVLLNSRKARSHVRNNIKRDDFALWKGNGTAFGFCIIATALITTTITATIFRHRLR